MTLLIVSGPLMLAALAIAVVPLLALSRAQHRAAGVGTSTLVRTDPTSTLVRTDPTPPADEPAPPLAA